MKNFALPIRFGIVLGALLISFFLVLSLFGLHTHPAYSIGNSIIVGFGIYETIRYYKLEQSNAFSYSGGFTVGIVAGFLATLMFTVFFLLYTTEINSDFLLNLLSVFKGDYNVSVGLVTFVVAIMGFATTVVLTLTCMQLFKKSRNIPPT
ncbi:DUF4199 domain-containing protein [Lacinutrix sp.]|uniref:DUF4199 domain-containing protein n=1 Tax=Lacinutrix sp. TaxID=1937692 RepID=UPI002627C83B|nr:DUF4199 domain-containing protein [Lacinutrix sp.]MDG1715975.1 DUF4199 domain-containing protein [Lacinutrix sp.]